MGAGNMKYQIPDDTLPGAYPAWTAHYLVIMLTTLLAGPLIGFTWAGVNGHLLGCRDMRRQWYVLGIGVLIATTINVLMRWLKLTFESGSIERLLADILQSAVLVLIIAVITYVADRQSVLHKLYTRERKFYWGIPIGIALVGLSIVLRGVLVSDMPLLRQAVGGLSFGFF